MKNLVKMSMVSTTFALAASLSFPGPAGADSMRSQLGQRATAQGCIMPDGSACPKPEKLAQMFKAGKLGELQDKSGFPKKARQMIIAKARKQGHIRTATGRSDRAAVGGWWEGLLNAADCVAPGAEASCKKDFKAIGQLKEPAKVALTCGGTVAIIYGTGGTGAAALGGGASTCLWGAAVDAW